MFEAELGAQQAAGIVRDALQPGLVGEATLALLRSFGADAGGPRVSVGVGSPSPVVAIPATALRKGPSGDHVFVLVPDAKQQLRAQLRPVKVGASTGDEVLVVDGLAPGDRVATSGSFKLRDAVRVAVIPPATTTSAAPAAPARGS